MIFCSMNASMVSRHSAVSALRTCVKIVLDDDAIVLYGAVITLLLFQFYTINYIKIVFLYNDCIKSLPLRGCFLSRVRRTLSKSLHLKPPSGIEPKTFSLQVKCSTAELKRH